MSAASIAEKLAMNKIRANDPGLESPPEMRGLSALAHAGNGFFLAQMLSGLGGAPKLPSVPESPTGFSQVDMLAARLAAGARQQAPLLKAEQMATPLREMYPEVKQAFNPMHGGRGADLAESGYPVPSPLGSDWILGPQKHAITGALLKNQQYEPFMSLVQALTGKS